MNGLLGEFGNLDALSLAAELANLISTSPKRLALFRNLKRANGCRYAWYQSSLSNKVDCFHGCPWYYNQEIYVRVCADRAAEIGEDANDEPSTKASSAYLVLIE